MRPSRYQGLDTGRFSKISAARRRPPATWRRMPGSPRSAANPDASGSRRTETTRVSRGSAGENPCNYGKRDSHTHDAKAGGLPGMYATGQRPYGVIPHAHKLTCDPGGGGFVRTRTVDDGLAAAMTFLVVLKQQFKSNGSRNDAIALLTGARSRVNEQHRCTLLAQTMKLVNGDAAHAQLLKQLAATPELQDQKGEQQREDQQTTGASERSEFSKYVLDSVVKNPAEHYSGSGPERRSDTVVHQKSRQTCFHYPGHNSRDCTEARDEFRCHEDPGSEAGEQVLGVRDAGIGLET